MMAYENEIENSLVPVKRQTARIILEAGYLLLDMGQMEEAREVFAGASALMPKSEIPQLGIGSFQLAKGDFAKALQSYRTAQRLAPGSSLPRAHAGEALLFLRKDEEALKELRKAVEMDGEGDGGRFAQALLDAKESGAFTEFLNGNLRDSDGSESKVR